MMHARTLKLQMLADLPDVNAEWDSIPMLDRHTLAFAKSLKESTALPTSYAPSASRPPSPSWNQTNPR